MNIYLLYNPISSNNKDILKKVKTFSKKMAKEGTSYLVNVLEISGKEEEFLLQRNENDKVIICGGDGTINTFINRVKPESIKCRIYLYTCGTGNDFARDFKKKHFEITEHLKNTPHFTINEGITHNFINGVGVGVDAVVCKSKQQYKTSGVKKGYLSIALSALKSFRPYSLDIEIDGEMKHFENTWFVICNQGVYMGGGMKVTPKASRNDEYLDICVVHTIGKKKIILIFPFIYLGLHTLFKKYVNIFKAKKVKIIPNGCSILQHDGEILENIKSLEVER